MTHTARVLRGACVAVLALETYVAVATALRSPWAGPAPEGWVLAGVLLLDGATLLVLGLNRPWILRHLKLGLGSDWCRSVPGEPPLEPNSVPPRRDPAPRSSPERPVPAASPSVGESARRSGG